MARDRDEEYDNIDQGVLFENTNRRNDRAPEWRGQVTVKTPDGEVLEYWVSCWEKTSRKGDPFMSLALELKEEQRGGRSSGRSRDRDDRDDRRGSRDRDRDDDRRSSRSRDRDDRDDRGRDRDDDRRSTRSRRDDDGDPRDRDRERKYDDDEKRRPDSDRDLDDAVPF